MEQDSFLMISIEENCRAFLAEISVTINTDAELKKWVSDSNAKDINDIVIDIILTSPGCDYLNFAWSEASSLSITAKAKKKLVKSFESYPSHYSSTTELVNKAQNGIEQELQANAKQEIIDLVAKQLDENLIDWQYELAKSVSPVVQDYSKYRFYSHYLFDSYRLNRVRPDFDTRSSSTSQDSYIKYLSKNHDLNFQATFEPETDHLLDQGISLYKCEASEIINYLLVPSNNNLQQWMHRFIY